MSVLARPLGWVLVLLAGGWLAFEATRPPPSLPDPLPAAEPTVPELPQLAPDAPLISEFKATLDRPLFSQDRRPEAGVAAQDGRPDTPTGPDSAADVRLSAVIVDSDGRSALLSTPQQLQALRVPLGGTIGGWRVEEIRDDAVVLRSGSRQVEVALRTFGPARPPAPEQVEPAPPRRAKPALLRRRPVQAVPGLEADEPLSPGDPEFLAPDGRPVDD
jgi:hypothetical protein